MASLFVAVEQVHRTQAGGDAARRRRLTSTASADDRSQHGVVADVDGRCSDRQRAPPGTVVRVEAARVDHRVGPAEPRHVDDQVEALTELARLMTPRLMTLASHALCTHQQRSGDG